jgi:hypothetical protein
MKGLSVFLALVLLMLAVWLPGRMKAAGKLPADQLHQDNVPALDYAKARPVQKRVRL